jgi:hypothetical protein
MFNGKLSGMTLNPFRKAFTYMLTNNGTLPKNMTHCLLFWGGATAQIVIIYENDQQDATTRMKDNLLFIGCSTCFEQYFRSSSGDYKMHYSFW